MSISTSFALSSSFFQFYRRLTNNLSETIREVYNDFQFYRRLTNKVRAMSNAKEILLSIL